MIRRIELDIPLTTSPRATDAWGALLDDSAFDKPEVTFDDEGGIEGDLANIYRGMYNDLPVAVKVTRDEGDNDLLENEAAILQKMYPPSTPDEKFYRYLPRMLFSTRWGGRQANVFTWLIDYTSMEAVYRAYPTGIDYQDMVWMLKRLLVAIGFAHHNDVVHGAVLPPHVMLNLPNHGAKLIDWSYARREASRREGYVSAMSNAYRNFYPPEVFDRQPPTPATDIYMAAKCAITLVGGDVTTLIMPSTVPEGVQSFLRNCVVEPPSRRPQNAWDLHDQFDQLLRRLVGPPVFRPFTMP